MPLTKCSSPSLALLFRAVSSLVQTKTRNASIIRGAKHKRTYPREFQEDRRPGIDRIPDNTQLRGELKFDIQVSRSKWRHLPKSAAHIHLYPDTFVVHIYPQSQLLWWLPEIQHGAPAADDPHFVLSTDVERLPPKGLMPWKGPIGFDFRMAFGPCSGPWLGLHPIKVLTATTLLEAVILLLCRDLHIIHKLDWRWYCMLFALAERKVPGQGRLHAIHNIREDFRVFWDLFRGHVIISDTTDIFPTLLILRDALIAKGELPDIRPEAPRLALDFMLTKDGMTDEGIARAEAEGTRPWMWFKFCVPSEEMAEELAKLDEQEEEE